MDDLVQRLRERHQRVPISSIASIYSNAADRIVALEAERDRLAADNARLEADLVKWERFTSALRAAGSTDSSTP